MAAFSIVLSADDVKQAAVLSVIPQVTWDPANVETQLLGSGGLKITFDAEPKSTD